MKTKTRFHKLTAWLLTLAMLMTFIPSFSLGVSAAEIAPTEPTLTTDKYDINGDDTMDEVYEITTAEELYWFAGLVNGTLSGVTKNNAANAILMNNITVNENVIVDGALTSDTSSLNVWTAMGKTVFSSGWFGGCFDGNGKTISGLYVNETNNYRGFIGCLGEGASIKNLTITNSYFASTSNSLGAFVGTMGLESAAENPVIENCKLIDSVVSGTSYVGGIVGGGDYGEIISNCYVYNCTIIGSGDNVGGIAGSAGDYNNEAYIRLCSINDSSVSGVNNVGGILGKGGRSSKTKISACCNYNTSVTATTKNAGGILGSDAACYSCFVTAEVSAPSNQGPFAGYGNNSSSAYDSNVYGEVINYASSKAFTTDEIKAGVATYYLTDKTASNTVYVLWGQKIGEDNYPSWNPDSNPDYIVYREDDPDAEGGYRYYNGDAAASYEPNEDGIYEIANRNDWYKFAKKANEDPTIDGILTDNIDFSAVTSDKIEDYRIGEDDAYTGSFDGNGYTVSGLPQMELPLFDTIGSGGELKNLTLSGATVNYISSTPAVGLVESNNGTVSGCAVSDITIIGSTSSAMIGTNRGTVTNCTATNITVTGKSAAAGIVYLNTGTIEKCNVVSGTVKAVHTENYDSHAGGICVRSGAGTIRECSNNADVIAESSSTMIYAAAGIVAAPSDSNGASVQVTKCFNSGDIKGGYAGGISGYDNTSVYANLSLCYNEGAITGSIAGGIAASGSNDSSDKIINCYNVGAVNATSKAGGIAGDQGNCIIENCHNYAKIVSDNIGAPIVGYSSDVWPGPDELINNHAIEGNVDAPTVSSYLDTKGATSNFDAVTKGSTREEFADGTVTAKLNAGNSETVWYQYNDYPILEQRHMHKWAYALEGTDTIKAECVNAGCDLTNNSGGSVTIKAPTELVYSGSAMDAECAYDNWLPNKPTIVYNEVDRVNVTGNDITASITLGDATATVDYKIQPREIISSMVTLSKTSVSYNGNEQTVTVTVKYNSSITLNADTDYEITGITSATDISTGDGYAVTVTGKGNYIGTVTKYWKINKGSLITQIELEGWKYLDTPNAPSVTNNPENGEVTYTYYVIAGRGYNPTGSDHGAQTEGGVPSYVGTYYVGAVIAETEHYLETTINGRQYKMFKISPREVTNPIFEGLQATYPYDNGNEIKPTFTLKDDLGNEIPASEYTVSYSNNTNGGEATITISDTEGGNYNISGSKTFEIVTHSHDWNYELDGTDTIKATCSNTDGSCDNTNGGNVSIAAPASLDYTGEAIEAVVTNNLVDKAVTVNVIYTAASGSELTENKPVKVGTYTASITLGDATAEVTFEIEPAPVVTGIDFNRMSPAYDAATKTFYVSDDFTFDLTVTGEYLTMLENAGGLKATFFGDTQNAGGTIMGMTIDSDTSAHGSYNIGSLSYAINNAGDGATYIDGIKVGGKQLDVKLKYAQLFTLTINSSENGSVSHDHTLGDDIPENVEVTLKVSPNAGYELETLIVDGQNVTAQVSDGKYKFTMPDNDVEVSATFKALPHTHDWEFAANGNVITATCVGTLGVCPNPTSTVTLVAPENLVYNGSEKVVTISGTIDGVTIPNVLYEGNRVNAGTFTAKLTINNATATLAVTITPKSISGAVIVLDNNANLVYTGNAITPDVTSVALDGITLVKDTDYTVSYSDNTNAGQATVTVTGKGNYKDTANTNFTIEKATPVVTAPTAKTGLAYTGQAHELINAGSTTGGTMQYSLDNATYSANIPTATNAGTYTVYYKVAGGNNYNDVAASSVEVTIDKQTVSKPTIESKEYTGTELTADVLTNELYTVSQDPKTDVGEYDVTITLKDTTNYKWADTDEASVTLKFNITAATNSWKTEPSISGWTFGQTASTPSYEAKFGTVKVEYKKAEESAYTATVPTNAGNYTARFSVAATNNYGALEKTVDFTIAKAQAVISVDTTPIEKFYGEALTLPEATSNIGSVTVDNTVAQMKDKGTYTVTYTVAGTNNYDGDTKTVNVTIKQLPVNIAWENAEGLVYDNTEKKITAVLANKVAGDNVNLTVEGVTSATEKGTYTATVTAVDNDNYTITNGTNLTKEWAISETANEWTSALSITGWTFGDNANAPTATAKFGTVEFTYADSIDGAFTDTVPTNAGTYYVKATVAGTASYAEISATAQFIIEAKELNANNITAIEAETYTGEEIKPVLEVKDGDTTLVLGTDYEVSYQNNVNAGTAKAVVTFKGNYKGNAEKEFTILKKQIDPAITLTAPVKNTAPQTEITGRGYTATVVWSPDVTDKFGYNTEYTATITITVDENHTVTGIAANGYTVEGAKIVTNDENSNVVTVAYEKTGSRPSSGGGGVSSYTVKFDTDDGSNVASKTVARNGKVAEPTAPTKDGFTFEGWYTDKELTTAYDFDTKVTKSFTLYAKWNEIPTEDDNKPGTPGHNCPSLKFSDLDITQWYHLDTDYVIENDIFRGTTESAFTPDGNITRAMMITVLYRAEREPEVTGETTFEDVDENTYYAKAVVWGQQNGIIKGYSETEYAPEQDILREQIAAIMHRYAQYKGYDVSVGENTNILSYDDFDSISEYAIASMQYACGSGLIKGKTASTLNPLDNATRAEIAAILHRFIEANK